MNSLNLTVDAINKRRVLKSLGYNPKNPPKDQLLEKVDALSEKLPLDLMAAYAKRPITERENNAVIAGTISIHSPTFCTLAKEADSVCFCLVTANSEIEEQLYSCEDTVDALIIDALGSVIVEQGVEKLLKVLAREEGQHISLPFSPGYCDFPLSEQDKIFSILDDKPLGVSYHPDSFMMSPTKTVSFVVAGGSIPLGTNPCTICQLAECQMRRL